MPSFFVFFVSFFVFFGSLLIGKNVILYVVIWYIQKISY